MIVEVKMWLAMSHDRWDIGCSGVGVA